MVVLIMCNQTSQAEKPRVDNYAGIVLRIIGNKKN